jgi:hypothetical protein
VSGVTLALIATNKNKNSINIFNEVNQLYSTLERVCDKYELLVINTCTDEHFNNDLILRCGDLTYCKFRQLEKSSVKSIIQSVAKYSEYENIIILNNDLDVHPLELDYIINNYTSMKQRNCFALFESNNSPQSNILGVVIKSYDLMEVCGYINAKSVTEFLIQMCLLYYHISEVYRVNNRISYFQWFEQAIKVKRFEKIRVHKFLNNCKKVYADEYKPNKKTRKELESVPEIKYF